MKSRIKEIIIKEVFQRYTGHEKNKWIFDFRRVTLQGDFLELFANEFLNKFKGDDIQVCGLESASIPLIASIVLESKKRDININGFFIRKSRKKHDLTKDIEGVPNKKEVVILDDILNSGSSVKKQIEILKRENIKVKAVFSILRFRDCEFYDFLLEQNIEIISMFELNDFKTELNVSNLKNEKEQKPSKIEIIWSEKYGEANFKNVVPKSAPILYEGLLYFGTDEGFFNCVNANDGKIIWQKKIWFGASGKMIFSTPIIFREKVFFGAYDGNFYCLNKNTGENIWINKDADWIGSSPAISLKNNYVYIGLEYGLWKKHGGIAAINIDTGKVMWNDTHEKYTHCSPFVSQKNDYVFCGSNDGILRIYNSSSGKKLKEHKIGSEMKYSFSENNSGELVAFGAFDGKCYIVSTKSLEIVDTVQTFEAIYSTPVWYNEFLIFCSLDKRIYCYDTKNKEMLWTFGTNGRIFSTPLIVDDYVVFGNNGGVLYKINLKTGKQLGKIIFAERIVNKIVYDKIKNNFFVPTISNEIYCIKNNL